MNLRRVYRSIVAVGFAVVIARLTQAVCDLVIAKYFGVGADTDAYFLASLIPMHLINVISGSISIAFVPRLIKVEEEEGEASAHRLIENTAALSLFLLAAVGVVTGIAFPLIVPYLTDRLPGGAAVLARNLYWGFLPMLVLSGMTTVWSGILTAKEKFGLPSIVPALSPLLTLVLLPVWPASSRIYALVAGPVIGSLLQLVIIGFALRRRGYGLRPRWSGWSAGSIGELGKDLWPLIGGAAVLTLVSLAPQFMAARLGEGNVSVLAYGQKLTTVLSSIAGAAVATVTQAYFSRLVALKDWEHLRHSLHRISIATVLVLGAVAAVAILGSEPMTRLLFQRGAFTAADTLRVSPVQALYALQIPFAALSLTQYRLVAALGARKALWQIPVGGVLLLIVAAVPLSNLLGVGGLALDVSIFHIVSGLIYWIVLSTALIPRASAEVSSAVVHDLEPQLVSSHD